MKNSKWSAFFVFLLIFFAGGSFAQANLASFDLNFVADTQSMWGAGGGSASIQKSGVLGSTNLGIGWGFGASTGTVEGSVKGAFNIDYTPYASLGSSTSVSMNYLGNNNGSIMSSLLGAYVNLDAYLAGTKYDIYNPSIAFDIDKTYTPVIGGAPVTDSASITAVSVGKDLWGLAGVSIDVDIEQNDTLALKAINGTLVGHLRNTGTYINSTFSMTGSIKTLNLNLNQTGIWDFSFEPFTLDTLFNVDFDAELLARAYIKYLDGGDHWYDWWKLHWETLSTEFEALSIDVYDGDPFALAFSNPWKDDVFSIVVGVPEPATLLLLGFGLIGLAGIRRKFNK